MLLKQISLNNFGCLRRRISFDTQRINLICDDNETGKSTLANAILASLFGFPEEQRGAGRIIEIDAFRPLSGEPYRVELELETKDGLFRIMRDFDRKTAQVWRNGANVTMEYTRGIGKRLRGGVQYAIGEGLLRLSRESFLKTALIRQGEINALREPGDVTQVLQRIADSEPGDKSADAALLTLETALREYEGVTLKKTGLVETEINRLSDKLQGNRQELERWEKERQEKEKDVCQLEELQNQIHNLDEEIQRLGNLAIAAEIEEIEQKLKDAQEKQSQLGELVRERTELANYAAFPEAQWKNLQIWKGKFDQRNEDLKELESRYKDEIEKPLADVNLQLEKLTAYQDFDADDSKRLDSLLTQWQDIGNIAEMKEQISQVRQELFERGIDIDKLLSFQLQLDALQPEEYGFLSTYTDEELKRAEAKKTAEAVAQEASQRIAIIDEARKKRRSVGMFSAGIGGLSILGGAVIVLALNAFLPGVALFLVGVLSAGFGIFSIATASSLSSDERAEQVTALRDAERRQNEIQQTATDDIHQLNVLAEKLSKPDGVELLSLWKKLQSVAREMNELKSLLTKQGEMEEALQKWQSFAKSYFRRAGQEVKNASITVEQVQSLKTSIDKRLELVEKQRDIEEKKQEWRRNWQRNKSEREQNEEYIRKTLAQAGITAYDTLDTGLVKFEEALKKHQRYRELDDKNIPEAKANLPSGAQVQGWQERLEQLRKQCPDKTLLDIPPDASSTVYRENQQRLNQQRNRLSDERNRLLLAIDGWLKKYRSEYPHLMEEQERLKRAKQRAERFRDAVQIAREVLEELSREAYAQWRDILNERANTMLQNFNPHWEELQFAEDLSFTLRERGDFQRRDKIAADRFLSAGARDQVYLAMRLAISEYFSRDEKLPLIFDEPFANFDDRRFLSAMRSLSEIVGKEHQILLLTCHRQRHEWLRQQDTAWFEKHILMASLTEFGVDNFTVEVNSPTQGGMTNGEC